ncbi:MAG: 6,7-dimethyl-8-ribityllumazine synthase [Proteobacteria bacterium]|nr:6,7-dimethyl-8-ribityllumazine synthase [Pseudomonadota bacterium]
MVKIYEGKLQAQGLKFDLVVSRFNNFISERLLEGALDALRRTGADEAKIRVFRAPGSFELPMVARALAQKKEADAIICLGALIRGGTPHFDFIAAEVTKGVAQVALESKIPVSFGVITADSLEQAIERAGTKEGNKGFEAALAAVELANLFREMKVKA